MQLAVSYEVGGGHKKWEIYYNFTKCYPSRNNEFFITFRTNSSSQSDRGLIWTRPDRWV